MDDDDDDNLDEETKCQMLVLVVAEMAVPGYTPWSGL